MLPRIAIAQFDSTPGDIAGNTKRMVEWIGESARRGAQLVIFPEESVSGYCIGDLNRNPLLIKESLSAVEQRIAPATAGLPVAVVVGLIAPSKGDRLVNATTGARNCAVVVQGGRIVGSASKTVLMDHGVLDDSRYFLAADPEDICPVEVTAGGSKLRLGLMLSHDMWDEWGHTKPSKLLRNRGADFLIVLNSSPFYLRRREERISAAAQRARETGLPLVYVNAAGVQDNGKNVIVLDGGSFVVDGTGAVTATFPQFEEGLYFFPSGERPSTPVWSREEELFRALAFGLNGFFRRTGHTGAVIGLSGGIDSAVTTCLLVRVLGRKNVLALNMPTRFSSQTTRDNARDIASRLGIEYVVHSIEECVSAKRALYEKISSRKMADLTYENVQARERGNVLMTWAQERGWLVIGNGNKTEFQRGYATMYGDMIGALMPLGDVAKTDVYRLARLINSRMSNPIPDSVIKIPPSAELGENQDITKGLGDPFDYDVEAPMGQEIIENERTPTQLRAMFEERRLDPELWAPTRSRTPVYDKLTPQQFEELAWDVFRCIQKTAFKRIQAPPVLKVSRRAFGSDLRESLFAFLKF